MQKWKNEGERRTATQERERDTHRETSARGIGRKKNIDCRRQHDSEGGGVQRLVLPQRKGWHDARAARTELTIGR